MPTYKSIRSGDPNNPLDKCGVCGQVFQKGDWIKEGFVTVSHQKCYRKRVKETGYVSPLAMKRRMKKAATDVFMKELQKMAKREMRK